MTYYKSPLKAEEVRQICLKNGLEIHDTQWFLLEKWSVLLLDINQPKKELKKTSLLYDLTEQ